MSEQIDDPRTVAYRSNAHGRCELTLEHEGERVTRAGDSAPAARLACMEALGLAVVEVVAADELPAPQQLPPPPPSRARTHLPRTGKGTIGHGRGAKVLG